MPNKRKRRQRLKRVAQRPQPVADGWVDGWSGPEALPAKMEPKRSPEGNVDLTVQELPDELLIEAFTCLSSSEQDEIKRVCRHWYAILHIPFFTNTITCHSLPDSQRCYRRRDMWDPCWRGHCTKERRTIRRRTHFSTPTALTFVRRLRDPAVPPWHDYIASQRMPCDIFLWLPRTITKVTFGSVAVRFAQITQLARNVERVCLDKVELVGITSLEESDAGVEGYRLPGNVDLRVYYSVGYSVRIKRAVLVGDFTKGLWDLVEGVVAGDACPREDCIERLQYYMKLKVADPDEDWNSYVDLFVRNVIAGRDAAIPLPAKGQYVDWTFPWHRLKPATLLELNVGLGDIVGKREHQLTP